MLNSYQNVPSAGWHQDSILTFDYTVEDTSLSYDILLHIRHTECYPYQNLWLFVNDDTINFYLADDRGRWLGRGKRHIHMPILYEQSLHYDSIGHYTLTIRQAMRDSLLSGISEVGVEILKYGQE